MGLRKIITGSLRVVARSPVIVVGRYGIVSELFEIANGPLHFVKNRFAIFGDWSGSLWD